MAKTLTLTLKSVHFVSSEEDIDAVPEDHVLDVSAQVFNAATSWAELHGWKAPGTSLRVRHLVSGEVASLLRHLREAIASEPANPSDRRARFSAESSIRAVFAEKSSHRQLLALVAFLERGGELVVQDKPEPYRGPGRQFGGRAARRT